MHLKYFKHHVEENGRGECPQCVVTCCLCVIMNPNLIPNTCFWLRNFESINLGQQ